MTICSRVVLCVCMVLLACSAMPFALALAWVAHRFFASMLRWS